MPSLTTSLCIGRGLGLYLFPTKGLGINIGHKLMLISNVKMVVGVLRRIKISMIIFYEFVDFIKVIRIKMIPFYAEMSLDRFSKESRFISVGLHNTLLVVYIAYFWPDSPWLVLF